MQKTKSTIVKAEFVLYFCIVLSGWEEPTDLRHQVYTQPESGNQLFLEVLRTLQWDHSYLFSSLPQALTPQALWPPVTLSPSKAGAPLLRAILPRCFPPMASGPSQAPHLPSRWAHTWVSGQEEALQSPQVSAAPGENGQDLGTNRVLCVQVKTRTCVLPASPCTHMSACMCHLRLPSDTHTLILKRHVFKSLLLSTFGESWVLPCVFHSPSPSSRPPIETFKASSPINLLRPMGVPLGALPLTSAWEQVWVALLPSDVATTGAS